MSRQELCRALLCAAAVLVCCDLPAFAAPPGSMPGQTAQRVNQQPSAEVIGWLVNNSQRQASDSPYALTDRSGTVYYYLRPSADMDLEGFLGKRVRVRGAEVELPNDSARLLEVEQIELPNPPPQQRQQQMARRANNYPGRQASANLPEPVQRNSRVQPRPDPAFSEGAPSTLTAEGDQAPAVAPQAHPHDHYDGDMGDCGPECDDCADGCCDFCAPPCGLPGAFWVRAEYLQWWTEGMRLPALVTTGPSPEQPGFLGEPGTQILYGNSRANDFGRSGGRLTAGMWLNCANTVGIQGDYFGLASVTSNYFATSPGNPILSRPFFDTRPDLQAENVEQVASPGSLAGSVQVLVPTQFSGAGATGIFNLCCCNTCEDCCCYPSLNGPGGNRVDFLLGYRFYRLSDGVGVTENLTSLLEEAPGSFVVHDAFDSKNIFNGVEVGTSMLRYQGRWSLEFISKLALGNNAETVNISGSTATTQDGSTTFSEGGLLAQRTNIGHYNRNVFSAIPQLNFNLGYAITPCTRLIVGYTFIYWSRVVRAGDIIDLDVNSTLLPNSPNPPAGDLRHPQFVWRDTDFWAQGINVGLEYRF